MTRIFDDARHKHYGPVRRMWVILTQLKLLKIADNVKFGHIDQPESQQTWDIMMCWMLDHDQLSQIDDRESNVQIAILQMIFMFINADQQEEDNSEEPDFTMAAKMPTLN